MRVRINANARNYAYRGARARVATCHVALHTDDGKYIVVTPKSIYIIPNE